VYPLITVRQQLVKGVSIPTKNWSEAPFSVRSLSYQRKIGYLFFRDLLIDIDSALGYLLCVDIGSASDVSVLYAAYFFSVEMVNVHGSKSFVTTYPLAEGWSWCTVRANRGSR
jgi:hypothetical protein